FLCELAQARWTTTPVLAVGSLAPARSSREWNPLAFMAMVSGGWLTEAWMAPEYMAAMRFWDEPTARMLTSFVGSSPSFFKATRVPMSDEDPTELTPTFLPFSCSALVMLAGTIS